MRRSSLNGLKEMNSVQAKIPAKRFLNILFFLIKVQKLKTAQGKSTSECISTFSLLLSCQIHMWVWILSPMDQDQNTTNIYSVAVFRYQYLNNTFFKALLSRILTHLSFNIQLTPAFCSVLRFKIPAYKSQQPRNRKVNSSACSFFELQHFLNLVWDVLYFKT